MKPLVLGLSGPVLSPDEARFFTTCDPFGFILFQRNIKDPDQLRDLIRSLRKAVGREDVPVFVDQEGGRVARLKPPHWPALPSMGKLGQVYASTPALALEAVEIHARLTAFLLRDLGFISALSPVVDLRFAGASDVIGDRSFGPKIEAVTALASCAIQSMLENGILPCIKHLPGHGRMKVDPHHLLPTVDSDLARLRETDFVPFKALASCPLGMTSHAIFSALDDAPASISKIIHERIIRGEIGFTGLLLSDDLAMKALSPSYGENARLALQAGSDLALYCAGDLQAMQEIDRSVGQAPDDLIRRWNKALELVKTPASPYDPEKDRMRLEEIAAVAV